MILVKCPTVVSEVLKLLLQLHFSLTFCKISILANDGKTRNNSCTFQENNLMYNTKEVCISSNKKETPNKLDNKINESKEIQSPANWLEEKELADSQINFLNSIIVDLQNKNVNLLSRITELEKCHDETNFKGYDS